MVTICSLDVLLSQFESSLLFTVWFELLLPGLHTDFSGGRSVRYSHLFQNIPQSVVIHTVTGFSVVNKTEVDVFLKLSCFSDDPTDAGNLISGSSDFCKTSLNIWKFLVHVLLKPGLENFEHYLTSVR